jgi:hypothetical protein
LKYDLRPGQSSKACNEQTVAKVHEKIHTDHRLTIREIAEKVNISFGSSQTILTEDFAMRRIAINCPFHSEIFSREKIPVVPHLPYSPNFAPVNFSSSPESK